MAKMKKPDVSCKINAYCEINPSSNEKENADSFPSYQVVIHALPISGYSEPEYCIFDWAK